MQKLDYRSFYKHEVGKIGKEGGGISARATLEECIKTTKDYLSSYASKKPFVVYCCSGGDVVYDSEKDPKEFTTFAAYDNTKEIQMVTEKTLYEIKDAVAGNSNYGYKLAVNSQGQWVMEIKGTGTVIAVDKANVSEVIPYTIGVQFAEGGIIYHYFDEKREFVKGDAVVMPGYGSGAFQVAIVADVDTKSKSATKELKYIKKLA